MNWGNSSPLTQLSGGDLASIQSLHDVCMAVELVPDWPDYIERFRELGSVPPPGPGMRRR